jgi:uncharacterized membrane protein
MASPPAAAGPDRRPRRREDYIRGREERVMSNVEAPNDRGALDGIVSLLAKLLIVVRSSFVAFVFTLGIVFFVTGLLMGEGVLAGLFGIFGVSSMIYALLGYIGLKLIGYT